MKFLKTVKGKVVASLAAVLIVSSAGVAFASSNAGDKLKDWYDGAFETTTEDALAESVKYGESAVEDFEADYADRKDSKAGQIDRKGDWETNDKTKKINKEKDEHINNLEGSKEEILESMGIEFYKVYQDAWLEIQDMAAEAEQSLNKDMNEFATAEGEAAVGQLNEDLDKAKEEAVSELKSAIEDAQEELSAELEKRGDNLEDNVTGSIDHEIAMLTNQVSDTLYDLTKKQEELIKEAAKVKEAEAKDAMDDVINNMSN